MGYYLKQKTIVDVAHQLRILNKKVVFTHGTFDLFHAGHSYFLSQSKKEGDILIVGVDSDKKVSKVKGLSKPIIPQLHRIEMLLNHKDVDFVFLIDKISSNEEKYYLEIYEKLFPHLMTYGRNFEYRNQFLKKNYQIKGVKYKKISKVFKEAISASKIIQKIKES